MSIHYILFNISKFLCQICRKNFPSKKGLDQHNALQHAKKTHLYPCQVEKCEVVCTTPYNLVDHYKNIHGDQFITLDEAKTYRVDKNNPKKMQKQKVDRKANKRVRQSCVCTICGKVLFKASNLKRHMLRIHKGTCFTFEY